MRRLAPLLFIVVLILWPRPVSTCAATPSELLDAIRDARGDSIPTSPLLTRVAEKRADQITVDYSHEDDGARAPLSGLRWGEILAWNSYPEDITERYAVHQWLESSGHRAILLGRWSNVGVGVANVGPSHYYAVIFATSPPSTGTPRAAPKLLPSTDTCSP